MRINGNQVISNTIVIAPGDRAEIQLPMGLVEVEFKTDPGEARLDFENGKIALYNMDNALGSGATPTVTPPGGSPIPLRIALYAIGEGANAIRVLHYTVG